MEYIHVKSLEKYHPGYKDRKLQWAKIYFDMVQGDPDCELIENEIDWGRLIKFILLELRAQRPLPLNPIYLTKNGFNLKKRSIELTINMLHNFITVVDENNKTCVLEEEKKKKREEKIVVPVTEVINYLNEKSNSSYRPSVSKNQVLVSTRYNEGFTLENFKTVIDSKCNEWLENPEMNKYLRPETLFGNKFESYLQASTKPQGDGQTWPTT